MTEEDKPRQLKINEVFTFSAQTATQKFKPVDILDNSKEDIEYSSN